MSDKINVIDEVASWVDGHERAVITLVIVIAAVFLPRTFALFKRYFPQGSIRWSEKTIRIEFRKKPKK